MLVAVLDGDADEVAWCEVGGVAEVDVAVDFGGVSFGAAGGAEACTVIARRSPSVSLQLTPPSADIPSPQVR